MSGVSSDATRVVTAQAQQACRTEAECGLESAVSGEVGHVFNSTVLRRCLWLVPGAGHVPAPAPTARLTLTMYLFVGRAETQAFGPGGAFSPLGVVDPPRDSAQCVDRASVELLHWDVFVVAICLLHRSGEGFFVPLGGGHSDPKAHSVGS